MRRAFGVRTLVASLAVTVLVGAGCGSAFGPGRPTTPGPDATPQPASMTILLATTTSTQDSGLLDVLIPDFERRTGFRVKTNAVGTGAALALGSRGDADVVLVHAASLEKAFMDAGNGARRLFVMHNDFIIVGPPSDPAHIKGLGALDALRAIATARATFISRGDNSGTDVLEKDLWKQTGLVPAKPWYVEAATGMGQALQIASEKRAYTVTDRGTYLSQRSHLILDILNQGDPPLFNYYHVITVDPRKFPKVNNAGANAFADYLVSADAQKLIASFGVEKFGAPLFFPDAGRPDPTG